MGLRFRKSVTLLPGVKLNIGKSSVGVSLGGKFAGVSLNTKTGASVRASLPGTGLSYTKKVAGFSKKKKSASRSKLDEVKERLNNSDGMDEKEKNQLLVEEYENHIEAIRQVHVECEDAVDWDRIKTSKAPYAKGEAGPKEQEAQKALDDLKPGFLGLFGDKEQKKALEEALEAAKLEDEQDYVLWEANREYADKVLAGDIDAYYDVITDNNPFEDLQEFGSGFEFGTEDPSSMEIEFQVQSEDVVPQKSRSLTKTGKVSEKALSKTALYDITQDYVCSCSIRLAREIFALLPVQNVIVHAEDGVLNTATGRTKKETILSVRFEREGFYDINFDKIDPSDFVKSFEHNMDFKKTAGFEPVERLS